MVNEALLALLIGTTHYVDLGQPQEAVIYYEDAQSAWMRLPNGPTLSGDWKLTEAGYFVAWKDGPSAEWRIGRAPSRIVYVDSEGTERGDVTRIVPGDAEKLAATG